MRRRRSQLLISLTLIALLAALIFAHNRWQYARLQRDPAMAFRTITRRQLPPGVRASAYARDTNDNLFHSTHYWLLTGSPAALRQVTGGTGFKESLEEARAMLPSMQRLFAVRLTGADVTVGYEWELDRDRWYCIFAGETQALYTH